MIKQEYCCDQMRFFLDEKKVAIDYDPRFREYAIHLYTSRAFQLISYCPWCGFRLPSSLRDLYCDTLRKLGYEPFDDDIPEKFKTDAWWREWENLAHDI